MTGEQRNELKLYEQVNEELRRELNNYKKQHERLRKDIYTVIADNKRLSQEVRRANNFHRFNVEDIDSAEDGGGRQDFEDIVQNLNCQLRTLTQENRSLDQIWTLSKDTIRELEKEIVEYRNLLNHPNAVLKLKEDYERKIDKLQSQLQELTNSSEEARLAKQEVVDHNVAADQRICDLTKRINELSETEQLLSGKDHEIANLRLENDRLSAELGRLRDRTGECLRREKDALHKMHEALQLAEETAERRDQVVDEYGEIREEYDKLVCVLGEVMRDAGRQVEDKVQRMKARYKGQIKRLQSVLANSLEELKRERESRLSISGQAEDLQNKLCEALKIGQLLNEDLQRATQNIVQLELKVDAFETIITAGEDINKRNEFRLVELEEYLKQNRNQRNEWRQILEDVTDKFKAEASQMITS